jgi:hypothetical protein
MKYTVTVNQLLAYGPCSDGLKLLETVAAELGLDPDQPVDFSMVLDRGGLKYAAWALRTQPTELSQRVAVRFAELALPVWEARHPDDLRPRQAIEAAKACLADPSAANLQAARAAADAAADAACAATDAADAAADAADAACAATDAAAYTVADAAEAAARAAADAACAARAGVPEADLIAVFKEELTK